MNYWIDVSNTCKSPLLTGIPRTVRGIYRLLKQKGEVIPIRWDNTQSTYCRLTRSEQRALDGDITAKPRKWWRGISRHWTSIDLPSLIQQEDWFIQVEIFQDRRLEWFQKHRHSFQSLAIFHDAIAVTHASITAQNQKNRFEDYMKSLHDFTQVISISDFSIQALQQFWNDHQIKPSKPIHKIYWPADFPKEKRSQTPNEKSREIIAISTLEQRKNHLTLLAAAEILWKKKISFSLQIIGKKCPSWGDRVVTEIHRLQEQGHPVQWRNQISDEALHHAYQQCRFTVYPSLVEGFGLPILESLWHYRPCICSSQGAMGEVAQAGGTLTTDVTSPEKLAESIKLLLENNGAYQDLVNQTHQIRFMNWEDYGKQLFPILEITGDQS